jgi:AcrR family transcriptional regulator
MSARISPIYRRLPPGPHKLSPGQVVRHQRIRIHGAMIEAVAGHGYEATSVRQVIALAGVSRRCFYEQFDNKQDCFLATFDLLAGRGVRRMCGAYTASGGGLEDRLSAAFGELAEVALTRRKAAALVLLDAQTAGAAGVLRLRRTTAVCERLLARSFVESPGAGALPQPIVRAMAGGLQLAISGFLRQRDGRRGSIAEEMLRWTLHFQSPAAERMSERLAGRMIRRLDASAGGRRVGPQTACAAGDARGRLLHSALRLAVSDDYRELTSAQIADAANVSMDAFFELFAEEGECFLAALDMLGEKLVSIASAPELTSSDWPQAVRRVIAELMRFLAERPLYARALALEASVAPEALRHNLELTRTLASLLTQASPGPTQSRLLVDGLAGALWHTVRCQVASERIELLPMLSDHLAYVALAPSIGAEAAAEVLSEDGPGGD